MKDRLLFISMLCLGCNAYAYEGLDSVFNSLASRADVMATDVKYSGSFSPDCGGFLFNRMDGNGWTKGVRIALPGTSAEVAQALRITFDKDGRKGGYVLKDDEQACFDEIGKIGYALKYDDESKTLYMLRADVEDQICIPYDWYVRDYHYAPVTPLEINWSAAAARLYTEMKYNSAFYKKVATKLEKAYIDTLEELKEADEYESYRALEKLAAACEDGHTTVYAMGNIGERSVASPFSTVLLGGRLYINSVECEALANAGMKRGMEIVSVNGQTPHDYANRELLPYISTSTPQWADHLMFDEFNFAEGRKGTPFNLVLTEGTGNSPITIDYTIGFGAWDRREFKAKGRSFEITDENIAILTLPDFASSDIRDYFDSVFPQILESDALVIDIRGNGGGNSSHADYILCHLTSDSIPTQPWRTPIYMPAYASWGRETETYEYPSKKMAPIEDKTPYLRPTAILTDRGTFSAAEDFCSIFKSMKRGLIVGTPTGGSTGNGVRVTLAKDLYANICSKHDYMPDGTEFVGIGIIPDIVIEPTPESYFSPEPNDLVLNKALSTLRSEE